MKIPRFLDKSSETASRNADWHATDPWVAYGMRVVMLLGAGLLLMSLMPISGAVVTAGSVTVEGDYQAVQHLEGGIVANIHVRNGDRVTAGDVIVSLDNTQPMASMSANANKVVDHATQEARLIAERDRKETFEPPKDIDFSVPENSALLAAQKALFVTRRDSYLGQLKVLRQRLIQAESELTGLASQFQARKKERDLNAKELATVMPLFEKGYVNQQRIGPLQREAARLDGEIGNLQSEMTKLKSARLETEARLAQADKEYSQSAAEELQKVQTALAEERQAKKAVSDKLARTEVRAPVTGVVHALGVHTVGGVVPPGGLIAQIIPVDNQLLVEARIPPQDIDNVHISQTASVRFSAFDSHTTPRLSGHVRKVSAAEIADKEGKTYFTAQIEVSLEELQKLDKGLRLIPGMPAEVYLETKSRTILSYLTKPLTDMMARAFREG